MPAWLQRPLTQLQVWKMGPGDSLCTLLAGDLVQSPCHLFMVACSFLPEQTLLHAACWGAHLAGEY